jgi:cell division transport system permease protein
LIDRLGFVVTEAISALKRNYTMTFATIITAAVSLFLIGGLGYVYIRTEEYARAQTGRFEMRVILKDGATFDQIRQTAAQVRAIPGVAVVAWIPKEKAWARERETDPELTEGVENPYPDEFKVTLKDVHRGDEIAKQIQALDTVLPGQGVKYEQDAQRVFDTALQVLRLVGGTVGGLLFCAAGLLIYNAIRLTIHARRLEIRVMQLVGASRLMIRIPFLIEGILQGAGGGVLASGLLLLANHAFANLLDSKQLPSGLPSFPFWPVLAILCAIGAVYGFVCSHIAVRMPLRST